MTDVSTTRKLQDLIKRLKAGDDSARWELLERAFERLRGLASKILGDFPRVKEEGVWQTTDVASEIRVRLAHALQKVELADDKHFFRLAARKVRYFLLDLVRRLPRNEPQPHENSPSGPPAVSRPDYQDILVRLLELLPGLPEDQYSVLDLQFSLGFENPEIAFALDIDERNVRRRRRRAYETLQRELASAFPGLSGEAALGQE